jgi:hypothetical protein
MQILSINDVKGGRALSWSGQAGRSYTQQVRVITDDPAFGPRMVAKALGFRVGASYAHPLTTPATEWDYTCYLQGFDCKEEGDDGKQWLFTLNYGPFNWVEQGGATTETASEGKTDPFAVPPKVSFDSNKYERYVVKDARGKPVVNTVGDPFENGIKRDDSRATMKIVRHERTFNSQYVQTFKDTCNQDLFLGVYQPNTVKCTDVTAEREYQADWGYCWVVTYSFEIRELDTDPENNVLYPGWLEMVENKGMREWDTDGPSGSVKTVRLNDGSPVTKDVMLNEDGFYDPTNPPFYRVFQIYPLQDFEKFGFPPDLLTVQSVPGQGGS